MTETTIKDINRFSWQRVWQFGGLYRQSLRKQIIIYTLIEALLVIVTSVFPREEVFLGASIVIWFMSLAVPFVFIIRDDTIVRLVPVKASERLTFYLLWSALVFPVLMGAIQWLLMYLSSLYEPNGIMQFVIKALKESWNLIPVGTVIILYGSSTIYGIALYMLITDAAITCRRHPILSAILRTALVVIVYTLLSFVVGVAYAVLGNPLSTDGIENMVLLIQGMLGLVSLPAGIWAIHHIYKYLK